jgi:hypothetical protein
MLYRLDNRKIMFANHAASRVGWREESIGKSMRFLFRSKEEYDREGKKFTHAEEKAHPFLGFHLSPQGRSRFIC